MGGRPTPKFESWMRRTGRGKEIKYKGVASSLERGHENWGWNAMDNTLQMQIGGKKGIGTTEGFFSFFHEMGHSTQPLEKLQYSRRYQDINIHSAQNPPPSIHRALGISLEYEKNALPAVELIEGTAWSRGGKILESAGIDVTSPQSQFMQAKSKSYSTYLNLAQRGVEQTREEFEEAKKVANSFGLRRKRKYFGGGKARTSDISSDEAKRIFDIFGPAKERLPYSGLDAMVNDLPGGFMFGEETRFTAHFNRAGRPVSLASSTLDETNKVLNINTIMTFPEVQNRGYATQLAIDIAARENPNGIIVRSEQDMRPIANRVFARAGYENDASRGIWVARDFKPGAKTAIGKVIRGKVVPFGDEEAPVTYGAKFIGKRASSVKRAIGKIGKMASQRSGNVMNAAAGALKLISRVK
jgi:hypothetical protein